MRIVLAASAALVAAGPAVAIEHEGAFAPNIADTGTPIQQVQRLDESLHDAPQLRSNCRDQIVAVREERGLPRLHPEDTPSPDNPYFIKAVDHRIDGCNVMVMADGSGDVLPLPEFAEDAPLVHRAQ